MGVASQFVPGTNTRQLIDDRVMKCERDRGRISMVSKGSGEQ